MVTIAHKTPEQIRDWVESVLPALLIEWQHLPEVLQEIDSWDDGEAMFYIEEWPLLESQRLNLERVASRGLLTAEQERQIEQLRQLVSKYQPQLNRLLGVS